MSKAEEQKPKANPTSFPEPEPKEPEPEQVPDPAKDFGQDSSPLYEMQEVEMVGITAVITSAKAMPRGVMVRTLVLAPSGSTSVDVVYLPGVRAVMVRDKRMSFKTL